VIQAHNAPARVADLATLMGNCLRLLAPGGELHIEVPFEYAPATWQDPLQARAMNENSWLSFTDGFWQLGWLEHRFEIGQFAYLDNGLKECGREQAAFMRLLLCKTETSPRERTTARAMQAGLGLPDDAVAPSMLYPSQAAVALPPQAAPAQSALALLRRDRQAAAACN
jgi:SAM-dependent methyltransferase